MGYIGVYRRLWSLRGPKYFKVPVSGVPGIQNVSSIFNPLDAPIYGTPSKI